MMLARNLSKVKDKNVITSIKQKKIEDNVTNYFCDFETILINGNHNVIGFAIVSENIFICNDYYQENYKEGYETTERVVSNCENLVVKFIEKCDNLTRISAKDKKRTVFYFHNFGRFDSIFLLHTLCSSELSKKYNISCITRDNVIYKLTIKHKLTACEYILKDSYLLLPLPLRKVGDTFCTKYKKKELVLISDIKDLYDKEKMASVSAYCLQDCYTLQEGFTNYMLYCKKILKIDAWNCLSLASISLAAFRTNYYDHNKTPVVKLSTYKDSFVRKAYLGGIVDVYKPYLTDGYHYDVNSLYPYIMKTNNVPIGQSTIVTEIDIENFFGYIKAEVESPIDSYIPYLSIKLEDGKIVSPIGKFEGVFFSEEIKYAMSLGYKFRFIRGLKFESKAILFERFVSELYSLRLEVGKESPLNTVIKLILNSLYGRFGLRPNMGKTIIIDDDELILDSYLKRYDIEKYEKVRSKYKIDIKSDFCEEKEEQLLMNDEITLGEYLKRESIAIAKSTDVVHAVHIAAAITAYARIFMHQMKTLTNLDIYYSDTDSIFSKNPLPKKFVDNLKLGAFKLEGEVEEGIFIAPKVYYIRYKKGEEMIKCKGLDSEKLNRDDIYKLYKEKKSIVSTKTNNFKRLFDKFIISSNIRTINISGDLTKRHKIFEESTWVDTKPRTTKD